VDLEINFKSRRDSEIHPMMDGARALRASARHREGAIRDFFHVSGQPTVLLGRYGRFGRLMKKPNVQSPGGLLMSKLISAVLAAAFAVATVSPVAFAQTKEEKAAPSKAAVDAACKDKKPGDVVKVDGKDVKCPAPKSAPK
jgi:hypothetical protein